MPYVVYLKRLAEKELKRLPTKVHDRIIKHLISLGDNLDPLGYENFKVERDIESELVITEFSIGSMKKRKESR